MEWDGEEKGSGEMKREEGGGVEEGGEGCLQVVWQWTVQPVEACASLNGPDSYGFVPERRLPELLIPGRKERVCVCVCLCVCLCLCVCVFMSR